MRMAEIQQADVLIVGGGAAGLAAAARLVAAQQRVILLEAQNRLGGRIHTLNDPAFPLPVELGAEFIHGRPEITWRLLGEAGAVAIDVPHDHWQRRDGCLVRLNGFSDEIAGVMRRLRDVGDEDMSFAQFLDRFCSQADLADARQLARSFVEGFDAAEPERISAKALATEWQGVGNVGEQPQFRVLRGYGSLIDHLRNQLSAEQCSIKLNTCVTEVRWKPGQVEIEAFDMRSPQQQRTFTARCAIVTLPVGLWHAKDGELGAMRFTPELQKKRDAARRLGYGSVVKVILLFDGAFWEDYSIGRDAAGGESLADACFLHDAQAIFPTWWTARSLRAPMLTAWAGGPKAHQLAGLSEEALIGRALDVASKLFAISRAQLDAMLLAGCAYDWSTPAFARGAYSYELVSAGDARQHLAEPVEDTLYFAGEATDLLQSATVAGALASGERAAGEVISHLLRAK